MDEYKLLSKKFKKEKQEPPIKKILFSILNQILICAVLFLIALIASKNKTYKEKIYKYVYSYNLSFSEIEKLYQKHFGTLFPTTDNEKKEKIKTVTGEKLTYESLEEIENGAKLQVGKQATITAFESGLVIFVGEKEGFGTILVLEQVDGVEAWYVGVDVHDLSIYDYVEKSSIVATSKDEYISVYFKKKGETVDYKNYVS